MRMSYSSATLQDSCARKYYLAKIKKVPIDPDNEDDAEALRFGSAYHQVLEVTKHDHKNFAMDLFNSALKDHAITQEMSFKVYACLTAYYKFRTASKLTCAACELELGGEEDGYIGYLDAVLQDKNGFWWITDLKTSSMLTANIAAKLPEDPQLNLYARYQHDVAKKGGLDPAKFAGVRYCSVAKPRNVIKAGESLKDFANRADPTILEIVIPYWMLDSEPAWAWVQEARSKAMSLAASGEEAWAQNRKTCFEWNRPCEYWSQCHGGRTYTKSLEVVEVLDGKTVKDCTLTKLPSGETYGIDLLI